MPGQKLAAAPPRSHVAARWNWRWAARGVEGTALIALITIAALHFTERPALQAPIHMVIDTPGDFEVRDLAISPDGHALAYTATTRGESMLWIRRFDLLEPRELSGSEGASMPFWSPDNRLIGFFARGKLKTIRVDGGFPLTITDAPQPHGGSWSSDGAILFAPGAGGLRRVRSEGGEPAPVISVESSRGLVPRWPHFLPDGRHFLFTALSRESSDAVYVGDLASGEVRLLIQGGSGGIYSDGRILFVKDAALLVQHFDVHRLELTGDAVPFAKSIGSRIDNGLPYSAGEGVLAYRTGGTFAVRSLLVHGPERKGNTSSGRAVRTGGLRTLPGPHPGGRGEERFQRRSDGSMVA